LEIDQGDSSDAVDVLAKTLYFILRPELELSLAVHTLEQGHTRVALSRKTIHL